MTEEQKKKIEKLWLSGKYTVNEIADLIGENKWKVYYYCASIRSKNIARMEKELFNTKSKRIETANQENRQQVLGPVIDYLKYHIPANADMMVDLKKVVDVIEQYIKTGEIKE